MLPRFSQVTMPEVPPARGGGAGRGGAAPAADAHTFVASRGKPLTVAAPGLAPFVGKPAANPLPGSTPAPPPPVTLVAIASQPAHGTLVAKPDGSFVYTPQPTFTGVDTFTYTINRAGATSAPATVQIIVK
jgi:hypothetical protein